MADNEEIDDIDYSDSEGEMFDQIRGNIYLNELDKRIKHTPCKKGKWTGERGKSFFEITDEVLLEKLKRYECNGIEYDEYAEPDFSKYEVASVWLENMGQSRRKNFRYATRKFLLSETAKEENINCISDFKKYKKRNKLSWHECSNSVTMLLLPRIIHQTFTHCGGISECVKEREEGLILR